METGRWTNPSHPQTLQIAVFLLYFNAVMAVLLLYPPLAILIALLGAYGAYGIANGRKWGYKVGVSVSALQVFFVVVLPLLWGGAELAFDLRFLISIIFPIALFCALVHPLSREHQRIWFD
jgi:hypothetical protein